jgi:NAD(P)-dependent dehydrogenase (short-subunit alcohol dehydrogenase family)
MSLHGRSAIITGANQGLGLAIARRFVESGANVLVAARDAERLHQAEMELKQNARPGQLVFGQAGDVSKPEDCQAIVRRALEALPGLMVLVNNAGVYGPIARIEDNDWREWVQAIEINLFSVVLMSRAILPHMREQGYGKIINLSGGGATAPLPRFSAYAASKAAVVRFTETLAEEVREDHIDVNAIAPGPLNTRLLDRVLEAGPERVGQSFYDRCLKQREEGGAPLDKGAALAAFLASESSDGISGRLLSAVWDNWAELPVHQHRLDKSDIYTLRRIVPEDRGQKWQCA